MNLGSRWNVIYNKLRNYRYDHWLITDDSVTRLLSFGAVTRIFTLLDLISDSLTLCDISEIFYMEAGHLL